jgi:diguanylate cyclase (GGDEF)-like protein/PAS domain S-box-containing protein
VETAALHRDEERRLEAVAALGLLDTPAEARFDRIVELAATLMDTPIALISLVDRDRQWFKARVGLDAPETGRDIAFCAHAIVGDGDEFVVEDARHDVRFADNPLVVGDPAIRFYAGHVVRDLAGLPLGTLCAIDRRPGLRTTAQMRSLQLLAEMVEEEFRRESDRDLIAALADSEQQNRVILDTLAEGLLLHDTSGRIIRWNPAAETVLCLSGDELAGRTSMDPRWRAVHADGSPWPGETHPTPVALATRRAVRNEVMGIPLPDGELRWLRVNAEPVVDDNGEITRILTAFADITAEVVARQAGEALAGELRHSEQMATVSLDALEQGVILASVAGHVKRMNPAAERMLGYDAAGLEARWTAADWPEFDGDGILLRRDQHPIRRSVATGRSVVGETIQWPRPDGGRITIRISVVPNATDDGELVIAFTDVTEEDRNRRLLDATLEIAPVGLAMLDRDRRILRCNAAFARQADREREDLIGEDVLTLLSPEDKANADEHGRLLQTGQAKSVLVAHRVARADAEEVWVETHIAVIPHPDMPMAIAATHDVTEHRRMTRELSMFGHLFENSNDLISVLDADGRARFTSPSAFRLLGYADDHEYPDIVLAMIHPEDRPLAAEQLALLTGGADRVEPFTVRVETAQGEWRHLECVGVNLLHDAAVQGIVVTARDATERVRLHELLARRANHDALTDLPNRNVLAEVVQTGLVHAAQSHQLLAVCFLDLDGFKRVNDTLGHAAGDKLLVDVADRLQQVVRPQDTVIRIGGDEFVVILDGVSGREEALRIASRLRDAVTGLPQPAGMHVGTSVGVTLSRFDDSIEELLRRADEALYRAKPFHSSRIEVFEDQPVG